MTYKCTRSFTADSGEEYAFGDRINSDDYNYGIAVDERINFTEEDDENFDYIPGEDALCIGIEDDNWEDDDLDLVDEW